MPMFEIIYGYDDVPKETWRVSDRGITDPKEASKVVKELNERQKQYGTNTRYMLRRVPENQDFVSREQKREDYKPFEVQGESFHCAELIVDKISFYSDYHSGIDNRRSEIKLGRYLRKYTLLTDNEIAEICARNGVEVGDISMRWARTREEIREVYEKGPNSCMSGDIEYDGCHPAEIYASPDLGIAYIIRDDRITARAVCNMNDKQYVTIYGDNVRLGALLEEAGFKRKSSPFKGCRVLKIPVEYYYYLYAYVDGTDQYLYDPDDEENKDYLIICNDKGAYACDYGRISVEHAKDDATCWDDCNIWEEYDDWDSDW